MAYFTLLSCRAAKALLGMVKKRIIAATTLPTRAPLPSLAPPDPRPAEAHHPSGQLTAIKYDPIAAPPTTTVSVVPTRPLIAPPPDVLPEFLLKVIAARG
jgi:hypothetical protein